MEAALILLAVWACMALLFMPFFIIAGRYDRQWEASVNELIALCNAPGGEG